MVCCRNGSEKNQVDAARHGRTAVVCCQAREDSRGMLPGADGQLSGTEEQGNAAIRDWPKEAAGLQIKRQEVFPKEIQ